MSLSILNFGFLTISFQVRVPSTLINLPQAEVFLNTRTQTTLTCGIIHILNQTSACLTFLLDKFSIQESNYICLSWSLRQTINLKKSMEKTPDKFKHNKNQTRPTQ